MGAVRRPAAVLPRHDTAAAGSGADRDRARIDARLGSLCRSGGQSCRDENFRSLRPAQGVAAQIRLRTGADHGPRAGDAQMQDVTRADDRTAVAHKSATAAPPCAMVIFGAAGELTKRLVVPALCNLASDRQLSEEFRIVGVDLTDMSADQWRANLTDAMKGFVAHDGEFHLDDFDQTTWQWLTTRMSYLPGDLSNPETYRRLGEHLTGLDKTAGTAGNRLFYL